MFYCVLIFLINGTGRGQGCEFHPIHPYPKKCILKTHNVIKLVPATLFRTDFTKHMKSCVSSALTKIGHSVALITYEMFLTLSLANNAIST